jgi:chitinase
LELLSLTTLLADYHGDWDAQVGHHAPLYQGPADQTDEQKKLNIDASIKYWLASGAPKEKLILGIPLYGRSFSLANPADYKPGAQHRGPGLAGPFTATPGTLGYNEFCEQQLTKKWTMEWEPTQEVPYAHSANQWVGFDNEKSIALKAKYILNNGLGGAMVWSLETDDFLGVCGGRKFPLLNALRKALNNGVLPSIPHVKMRPSATSATSTISTTAAATTVKKRKTRKTRSTTVTSRSKKANCAKLGTFRDPNNCSRFYICWMKNQKVQFQSCGTGTVYDTVSGVCNWPAAVNCSNL